MKGYLITYNSSSRKDVTKINHFLFGRVANIKKEQTIEKYYYPGFFEKTPYKKVANGCYFVRNVYDDLDGLLRVIPAEIFFGDNNLVTAKDYWSKRLGSDVNNWEMTNND